MSDKKFKIYSSSAGSGKTYTLSKEYLKLALQNDNPHYFKHILAITFTNDAANEMKSRILEALRGFAYPEQLSASDLKKNQSLKQDIVEELGISPELLSQRAQKVFSKILYNYADFVVSTIDSFVNRVISAFTRELEIPYNYEIDLDTQQLLEAAVDRVMNKIGQEGRSELSGFLLDWVQQKAEEGKSWARIAADLVTFSEKMMNENAYPFLRKLRALEMEDFQVIHRQMSAFKTQTDYELQKIARQGWDLIKDRGLEGAFSGGAKASVAAYFHKHSQEPLMEFVANEKSYIRKALEQDQWYTKSKVKADQIAAIEEIKDKLREYILSLEALKAQKRPLYNLIKLLLPQLYKMALIQEIEEELEGLKEENRSIHISDTNKKISEIINREPVPFIYERVGEKYNHILIDEFQDTSILQWENLLPLIENNLSEGKFNLLVGDAKQAIYRWRGGEMEQLVYLFNQQYPELIELSAQEESFLSERLQVLSLNHQAARLSNNYRSAREIIQFNNDFFRYLANGDLGMKYPKLSLIYDESAAQKIPPQNAKAGGQIEITFIDKGNYYEMASQQRIMEIILESRQKGFSDRDMAILCRSNARAQEIANFLQAQGIDVISEISLLLFSDERVRFLIALFKIIHRPEESLVKSEVLYLFYKVVKKELPQDQEVSVIHELIELPVMAIYDKLKSEGYDLYPSQLSSLHLYELAEKLIRIFSLLEAHGQPEYLFRLLDIILKFTLKKTASMGDFLEYWEEKKYKLSINTPKDREAITVTSIHKSKGLEYPLVILPYADWKLLPGINSSMWAHLPEEEEIFFNPKTKNRLLTALLPLNKSLRETHLRHQYQQELEKSFIENLNLLYVAFTRASRALFLICQKENFDKVLKTDKPEEGINVSKINQLLFLYLKERNQWEPENDRIILEAGSLGPNRKEDSPEKKIFWVEDYGPKVLEDTFRLKKNRPSKAKK